MRSNKPNAQKFQKYDYYLTKERNRRTKTESL